MNTFDNIIGYESIKKELLKISDVLKNFEKYEKLGAKWPHGLLLYGKPGLGKTTIAEVMINNTQLQFLTIKKTTDSINLINDITETFEKAKKLQPCIIFIDDLDKFSSEENEDNNSEEFVTIQAAIDSVKDDKVYVVATANNIYKLPRSLKRNGRFDTKIEFNLPSCKDTMEIIKYYLNNKHVSNEINIEDITKMLTFNTCADLESIVNESAIIAGYENHLLITMDDIVKASLKNQYGVKELDTDLSKEEIHKLALHEAGHLVVSEVLTPNSVGLASICPSNVNDFGGFIHRCIDPKRRPIDIMISLGGKVAVELYYSETCASGCYTDLNKVIENIYDGIMLSGTCGTNLLFDKQMILDQPGSNLHNAIDYAAQTHFNHYINKTRDIIIKNQGFLEQITKELEQKNTLLFSDIQNIKSSFDIVNVNIY